MIAPGGLLLFGLSYFFPKIGVLLYGKEISFGDLGLFVILAYVAGHIAQGLGDLIEFAMLQITDWPTSWARNGKEPFASVRIMEIFPEEVRKMCGQSFEKPFLSPQQLQKLPFKIREVLKIDCPDDLSQINSDDWFYITRQAYGVVKRVGLADRVDIFNGHYALMRGTAASLIILLLVAFLYPPPLNRQLYEILGIIFCIALWRMHRFGIHYARELFVQLLNVLPADLEKPPAKGSAE